MGSSRPAPEHEGRRQADAALNERARIARLERDARKSPGQNLEEGAAFVKFAHEFAAAFEERRSGQ